MRTSFILLLAASTLYMLASAQAPTQLCCMAFATVDTTLYIQGGSAGGLASPAGGGSHRNNQFFSLDLTLSGWNTSSPPWKVLPVGVGIQSAPSEYDHTMTATKDNKKLIIWGPYTGLSTYDLTTTVWTAFTSRGPTIKNFWGKVSSALDPTTGLIYFPEAANLGTGMLVYDPATSTTSIVPTYPSTVLSFQASGYSFVWSELRKSFLFFGGTGYINNMTAFNQYMIEYQPSTYSWTRISTVGNQIELAKHCMIPAYGGTKMVVFGGEQPLKSIPAEENEFSSALYMLDVMTMNWTLLSEGEVAGRSSIACTVVGDNFVVWGGAQWIKDLAPTSIYNLRTNRWVDQYIFTGAEHPSATSPANQLGIYIGVGVAVAVCVAVLGWIVFRCRKSRATQVQMRYKHVPSPSADLELHRT